MTSATGADRGSPGHTRAEATLTAAWFQPNLEPDWSCLSRSCLSQHRRWSFTQPGHVGGHGCRDRTHQSVAQGGCGRCLSSSDEMFILFSFSLFFTTVYLSYGITRHVLATVPLRSWLDTDPGTTGITKRSVPQLKWRHLFSNCCIGM